MGLANTISLFFATGFRPREGGREANIQLYDKKQKRKKGRKNLKHFIFHLLRRNEYLRLPESALLFHSPWRSKTPSTRVGVCINESQLSLDSVVRIDAMELLHLPVSLGDLPAYVSPHSHQWKDSFNELEPVAKPLINTCFPRYKWLITFIPDDVICILIRN